VFCGKFALIYNLHYAPAVSCMGLCELEGKYTKKYDVLDVPNVL
jgi:hypothetical protein